MLHFKGEKSSSLLVLKRNYLENFLAKPGTLIFLLLLIILVLSGIAMMPFYSYSVNPDCISYMSIAQKYASGNFKDAVNGYWGPLYSWLLVPFILSGLKPFTGVLILHIVTSVATLAAAKKLSYRFHMSECIRNTILISLIPVLLDFAFDVNSPDLLFLCIISLYFSFIFDNAYLDKSRYAVYCGISAGLAYLTKSYALPFFLCHFAAVNIFYFIKQGRRQRKIIATNYLIGTAVFLCISSPWILAISNKYHMLTFSTSGSYNFALFGPQSKGHPMHYAGLLEPPNKTAVSVWEDISFFKMQSWNPFNSVQSLKYLIRMIVNNAKSSVRIMNELSHFTVITAACYILILPALLFRRKNTAQDAIRHDLISITLLSIFTIIIYISGYLMIYVEHRYLWPVYFLLVMLGGQAMELIFKYKFLNNSLLKAAVLLLIVWMQVTPAFDSISHSLNVNKDIYYLSRQLSSCSIKGRIASNGFWHQSLYLSFFMGLQYYGEARGDMTEENLKTELLEKGIDYYFSWNDVSKGSISGYEDVTGGKIPLLKVYKIR